MLTNKAKWFLKSDNCQVFDRLCCLSNVKLSLQTLTGYDVLIYVKVS